MRVEEKMEKQPEFKGGINELSKFIKNNTIYPKQALADNISGLVVVKFVVRKDGNLSNIEVAKSLRPDLDQEAIRIVTLSNNLWSPATKNGNKVSANYYLPITFFTSKAAEKKYYKAKQ
ncbi:energy transducer TonB [Adhaeribacter arboris]|nr:energy transducer TonB [Adhaeribacter arboris]